MKTRKYSPEYMTEARRQPISRELIQKAIEKDLILESRVLSCDDKLTLKLELGKNIYGYIPFEELEFTPNNSKVKDVAAISKVGRHVKFKVLRFETNGDEVTVHCSRRAAQEDCYNNFISKKIPGDIIDARIVRVENYGVFCDIGCGYIALLPTNNISVTHVVNPKEFLDGVSRLKVIIQNIDSDGKVQLSHKELLGTWEEEASKFSKGEIICGKVLSVEEYGIFIRLSQNLSGLAAIPDKLEVSTGDMVSIRINNIVKDSLKIKLTIINKLENCKETNKFCYYKTDGNISEWTYYSNGSKIMKTSFIGGDNNE